MNLGVGQIPVTFGEEEGNQLWMKQKEPEFGATIHPEVLAEILQINVEDINTSFPPQVSSTGLPSVIVPLKTLDAVKKCAIHHARYKLFLKEVVKANILVFALETYHKENDLCVRVFVDDTGFPEDPATGSANGNLAGYLLEHNFFKRSHIRLRVEQGYEIHRPSLIQIDAQKKEGVFHIHVGSKVFPVAKGEWL